MIMHSPQFIYSSFPTSFSHVRVGPFLHSLFHPCPKLVKGKLHTSQTETMPSLSKMEDEEEEEESQTAVEVLSPSTSSRRSSDSNPPEFEFWMVRNPSCPQQDLHSADELFSGGVLLPLHQIQPNPPPPPPTPQEAGEDEAEPLSGLERTEPRLTAALTGLSPSAFTSSKRWRDIIFKRIDRNSSRNGGGGGGDVKDDGKEKDKAEKKENKSSKKKGKAGNVGNNGVTAAELNINIWPFRRSRSAGNGGNRPRAAAASTRKVSSAPCSRSNSAGESKSRKWPTSPSRGGVHLGRNSPVWQVRRGGGAGGRSSEAFGKSTEKGVQKEATEARRKNAATGGGQKARVLNINVPPMCIGYRQQLSCRSDKISLAAAEGGGVGGSGEAASGEGVRGSNIFNIRSLFTKKVY